MLLFLAAAWTLQQGSLVAALSAPSSPSRSRPSAGRVELKSSGFIQVLAEPSKDADGAASEVWPEAATDKHEVNLGFLKGGTRPQKVKIGDSVFVRKKVLVGDSQAIMMEALANHLYEAAKIKSERCRYYPAPQTATAAPAKPGRKGTGPAGPEAFMLCRFIDGLKPVMDYTEEVKKVVSENFVLDAAFANYDVGGMNGDNLHRYSRGNVGWDSDKNLVRIDNGGALAADGLGEWKPTAYTCKDRLFNRMTTWSPEPFQLWDFQRTSDIYKRLSKTEILKQVQEVMAKEKDILAAVDTFDGGIANERVKATLKARLECLGRIAKDKPDLLDPSHVQFGPAYDRELPSAICNGVRTLCADLLGSTSHGSL